eukprot:1611375-Lingulodinium_polyedra.AAC.1
MHLTTAAALQSTNAGAALSCQGGARKRKKKQDVVKNQWLAVDRRQWANNGPLTGHGLDQWLATD